MPSYNLRYGRKSHDTRKIRYKRRLYYKQTLIQPIKRHELAILTDTQSKVIKHFHTKHANLSKSKSISQSNIDYCRKLIQISPININFTRHNLINISKDTHYRNQFETGSSNGHLCKFTRTTWENKLFDNLYNDSTGAERVKYGNLNIHDTIINYSTAHPYGKYAIKLKNNVKERSTFTLGDSNYQNSDSVYTFKYPELMTMSPTYCTPIHLYYPYVEVQIHGELNMKRDVESIIAPSESKNDKEVYTLLTNLSRNIKSPIEWY